PRGERGDARLAGDLRPALGGERRGLLVADVDDVDALLAAAVVDGEQVAAGEREELRRPARLEATGDEAPAVQPRLGLGLGRHALESSNARTISSTSGSSPRWSARCAKTTFPPGAITSVPPSWCQ